MREQLHYALNILECERDPVQASQDTVFDWRTKQMIEHKQFWNDYQK